MVWLQRQCLCQLVLPILKRLSGAGVHEIKADVVKHGTSHVQGGKCLFDTVLPTKGEQRFVTQTLNTKRKPVYACVTIPGKAVCVCAGGVGFQTDFNVVAKANFCLSGEDDRGHRLWPHQRRRAPTKEDGCEFPALRERGKVLQLPHQGRRPPLVVRGVVWADFVNIEIAIGAAFLAKGPVNVKTELEIFCRDHSAKHAATSCSKA